MLKNGILNTKYEQKAMNMKGTASKEVQKMLTQTHWPTNSCLPAPYAWEHRVLSTKHWENMLKLVRKTSLVATDANYSVPMWPTIAVSTNIMRNRALDPINVCIAILVIR